MNHVSCVHQFSSQSQFHARLVFRLSESGLGYFSVLGGRDFDSSSHAHDLAKTKTK